MILEIYYINNGKLAIDYSSRSDIKSIKDALQAMCDYIYPSVLYLFRANDQNVSVTGGYINSGGTFTTGSTLKISSINGWAYAYSSKSFDVTNYNIMSVKYRGSLSNAILGLVDSQKGNILTKYQKSPASTTAYETITFDISNESGNKYLQIQAYTNCFLEIAEITLS